MSEQLKKRFDVIELKVAMGDLDQFSCFTQMRTAAMDEAKRLEAEIKRLTGFVVQRRKMCDDYDKALEEVANRMHAFKAELATEKARADAAVGDANEAEAELAEAVGLLKDAVQDFDFWQDGAEAFLARHGDKS